MITLNPILRFKINFLKALQFSSDIHVSFHPLTSLSTRFNIRFVKSFPLYHFFQNNLTIVSILFSFKLIFVPTIVITISFSRSFSSFSLERRRQIVVVVETATRRRLVNPA